MQQHYELVYLLRVSLSDEDAKRLHEDITGIITKNGTIVKAGEIGKRKLAYAINNESHAIYWMVQFDAETPSIAELHRLLSLDQRVLRFQVVAAKPKTQEDIEREERIKESIEKERMKTEREEREKEKKVAAPVAETSKHDEKKEKLSLDELDKKLDELLDDESLTT